ncbi:VCBS repeat-containing protein [bacterium]|nr:VCBS repeat-containing protein [bacterium]
MKILAILIPLTLLLLCGCGSGGGSASSTLPGAGATTPPVTQVRLNITPTNPVVGFEASRQLEAVVTQSDGSSRNVTAQVTWSSDDARFVTVSSGGLATGKRVGSTRVRASVGSLLAAESILVSPLPASGRFRSFRYAHFDGGYNSGLEVGDFNEDGRDDLIRVDGDFTPRVDLLLGDGAGNFTRFAINPGTLPAFFSTVQVLVKDLTGDGHLDAVVVLLNQVATAPRSGYVILVGDGQGHFAARPPVLFTLACTGGVLGDFNGDGRFDLALRQSTGGAARDVVIALGIANGDFGPLVGTSLLATSGSWLSAGRFGPDPLDDLVSSLTSTSAGLLDGRADGIFTGPPEILNGSTFGAHVADFNGDGANELALSRDNSIEFFQRPNGATPVSVGNWTGGQRFQLQSGDFNADGRRDLVGGVLDGVLLSFNQGNFQAAAPVLIPLPQDIKFAGFVVPPLRVIGAEPASVVMDFNGDGVSDLAHQTADNGLFLVAGERSGNLAHPQLFADLATNCRATSGDFNEDGLADFVGVSASAGANCTLLSQGSGNYQTGPSPLAPMQGLQVEKADLNQDGHLDLVVAPQASTNLFLALGNGQGQFSAPVQVNIGQTVARMFLQDLNGDNVPDLLVGSANQIAVFLNNGQGQMQRQADLISGGVQLTCDDFNRDGLVDLASAVGSTGPLQIRFGNGNGSFAAPTTQPLNLSNLASLDINRDGAADLAACTPTGVQAVLNNGNGIFTVGATLLTQTIFAPKVLLASDLNQDGFLDLVGCIDPYNVSVLLSEPGGLGAARVFAFEQIPSKLEVADVQGDGILDLIRLSARASALLGQTL